LLAFDRRKDYSELKLLTLRAVACGNVLSLSLESNLKVDDRRFAVNSLMNAREPHHGVMLILACFLLGKRGASYQMTRPCKAFR
jgi:ribulose 1,5-bisphosphate carboxylase large subunit-like protein